MPVVLGLARAETELWQLVGDPVPGGPGLRHPRRSRWVPGAQDGFACADGSAPAAELARNPTSCCGPFLKFLLNP